MPDKPSKPAAPAVVPLHGADVPRESPAPDVEVRHPGAEAIAVVLRASGIARVGDMKPGKTYLVEPREAIRLVEVKGFAYATPEDEDKAAALRKAADAETAAAVSQQPEGGGPTGDSRHRGGTPISNDEE